MAIEVTVTKKSASIDDEGIYVIAVNMVLEDNLVEQINKDFSQVHNPANDISVARDELLDKIQTEIDQYQANKAVYTSVAFTNAVTYINANLVI